MGPCRSYSHFLKILKMKNFRFKTHEDISNFSAKKNSKEIYHVIAYARNSNFSAFSVQSKLSCDALKFSFFALKFEF